MADINYLESEQKEAWKRIVELEKKAELFKADIVLYKTPIPSDISNDDKTIQIYGRTRNSKATAR